MSSNGIQKSEIRQCEVCGKERLVWRCHIIKGHGRFCSKACHDKSQRKTPAQLLAANIDKPNASGCVLWLGCLDRDGYGVFGCRKKQYRAHCVSYEVAFGDYDKSLCVLHRCDVRNCVNPDHLFLGTNTDNQADKMQKKRHVYGERQMHAKLTDDKVREILEMRRIGVKRKDIAAKFGIHTGTIDGIYYGKSWRHIPRN